MNFKNEIAADLGNVFLNLEEFAEEHHVAGIYIPCFFHIDKGQSKSDGSMYDLAEANFVVIAKSADLPARKEAGSVLNLDGRELTVSSWDEQSGITVVGLYSPVTA